MKKAINKETGTEYKVLVSGTKFNTKQMAMIEAIIKHFDALSENPDIDEETRKRWAARLYRRVEIYRAAVAVDQERACAPYYLTKNVALRTASGLYDLKRCKPATAEAPKAPKAPKATKATNETPETAVALLE